jgi:hypothetical protein
MSDPDVTLADAATRPDAEAWSPAERLALDPLGQIRRFTQAKGTK